MSNVSVSVLWTCVNMALFSLSSVMVDLRSVLMWRRLENDVSPDAVVTRMVKHSRSNLSTSANTVVAMGTKD